MVPSKTFVFILAFGLLELISGPHGAVAAKKPTFEKILPNNLADPLSNLDDVDDAGDLLSTLGDELSTITDEASTLADDQSEVAGLLGGGAGPGAGDNGGDPLKNLQDGLMKTCLDLMQSVIDACKQLVELSKNQGSGNCPQDPLGDALKGLNTKDPLGDSTQDPLGNLLGGLSSQDPLGNLLGGLSTQDPLGKALQGLSSLDPLGDTLKGLTGSLPDLLGSQPTPAATPPSVMNMGFWNKPQGPRRGGRPHGPPPNPNGRKGHWVPKGNQGGGSASAGAFSFSN